MVILSDKSIRSLVEKHSMIEPFQEEQIKVDPNGNRLISYRLSSYGYDARVADEFKIFTNIDSAVVDTKDFLEASFVDR